MNAFEAGLGISGLADDLKRWIGPEHPAELGAQEGLIINNQGFHGAEVSKGTNNSALTKSGSLWRSSKPASRP